MNLTIKLLEIHWIIIQKLLEIFEFDKEYKDIDEYINEKERRRSEINPFVLSLLLKHRAEIQLLFDRSAEQAESIINQHVINEWGVRDGERAKVDEVKNKGIEMLNLYILTALVSTSYKTGVAEQLFDETITNLKAQKHTILNDLVAIKVIVQNTLKNGLSSGYMDKKGIVWRFPREVKAIVDHLHIDTFNLVLDYEIEARGIELVRIGNFPKPRHACAKLQASGIICVVPREQASKEAQKYPNVYDPEHAYAEPAGHRGINCRHAWHSIDTSEIKMDIYGEVNKVNRYVKKYKRALERKVGSTFNVKKN